MVSVTWSVFLDNSKIAKIFLWSDLAYPQLASCCLKNKPNQLQAAGEGSSHNGLSDQRMQVGETEEIW